MSRNLLAPYLMALLAAGCLQSSFAAEPALEDEASVVARGLQMKDRKQGLQLLEKFIATHPNSAAAYFTAAKIANILRLYPKTAKYATKYLELARPSIDPYVYDLRAHAYSHTNQVAKALADLDLGKKANPKNSELYLLYGDIYKKQNRLKEARANYLLSARYGFNLANYLLAEMDLQAQDYRSAARHLIDYSRADKSFKNSLHEVRKLVDAKKYSEALIMLDEFELSDIPDVQDGVVALKAHTLYYAGRNKEALAEAEIFERKYKKPIATLKYYIYFADKNWEKALVCLNQIVKERPYERGLHLLRGDCNFYVEKYQEALDDYKQVPDLVSGNLNSRRIRAQCLYHMKQVAEAIKELDAINNLEPRADTMALQGHYLAEMHRYKEAILCFNGAIKLKPLSGDYLCARADCYRRQGNNPRALKDFSDAIMLQPDNMMYTYGRGLCLAAMGNHKDAIKDFSAAQSHPALESRALQERAKAYEKLGDLTSAAKDKAAASRASRSMEDDLFKH